VKTRSPIRSVPIAKLNLVVCSVCTVLALTTSAGTPALTVHEWGTFTSVQGGDGAQLAWFTGQASELPQFVYDWSKPGLDRPGPMRYYTSKVGMRVRQRMETPVIYFYTDQKLTADVTVNFPSGLITEWFPQAAQIGPAISHADLEAGKPTNPAASYESQITWRGVEVLPANQNARVARRMPVDSRGEHYFAARETDSAFVRVNNRSTTNNADEFDKLLFYRGAGNFSAPLTVMSSPDGIVTVTNSSKEPLADLFLLQIRAGQGELTHLSQLAPGVHQNLGKLSDDGSTLPLPLETVRSEVSQEMESALVAAGLFPREAAAMVKTWSDLWFAEEGVRVLYLLPRSWTDEILPITIAPAPQELVRVMVGRAEIMPPSLVRDLASKLDQNELRPAQDAATIGQLAAEQKKLGRFSSAAFQLANQMRSEERNKPVAAAARP